MRVYQEIDALRTMNINPIHYLVLPRVVAIALGLPMLVVFGILVGWLGGAVVCSVTIASICLSPRSSPPKRRGRAKDVANGVFKSSSSRWSSGWFPVTRA